MHHESLDGTGYPRGIANGQIPLARGIGSVAGVFNAPTTPR